jgi:Flp pilus assembly protein TadG
MRSIISNPIVGLSRQRRGVVALEFALVVIPFFVIVLGVMELSYDLFVQAALNYAVSTAARSVQVGSTQGTSGESSSTLAAAAVCPAVAGLLSCGNIIVGVTPITAGSDYYTDSSALSLAKAASAGGAVCTGVSGQMMLITAWYTGPSFVGALIPGFTTSYGGSLVHLTTASAGFVNEDFTGGQSSGSGC